MAPSKRGSKASSGSTTSAKSKPKPLALPKPFRPAPATLQRLYDNLGRKHIYVVHTDPRPAAFKRKIFAVPVLMNLAVALLFAWRAYAILPYYLALLSSTLGYPNDLTLRAADLSWAELAAVVLRRSLIFVIDFVLAIFVWPWPWEFLVGGSATRGSPVGWRWVVGFRDSELYVRRSRSWDAAVLGSGDELFGGGDGEGSGGSSVRLEFWDKVRSATNPLLLEQKTGYLLMDGAWDLDWDAMVLATSLVDGKEIEMKEFSGPVVLLYSATFGWVTVDLGQGEGANEDERRKQVFAFREALVRRGKEDLFFRWIEIVQYETSKPGGFGTERQNAVAEQIRELFKESGVDFDAVWGEVISRSTADQ